MDALTALADGLNLRAKLVWVGGVCGQWLMDHNSDKAVWFHLVSKGRAWVHSPSSPTPQELTDGDLILFLPHATQHFLSYSSEHLPFDMTGARVTGWGDGETGLVCGEIELGMPKSALWLALPPQVLIRKTERSEVLARLIELILAESLSSSFGCEAVVERLCDSLFILVIRHCIETNLVGAGVFAAMQDPRLAILLESIHLEPWRRWTIAEFCGRAGLSKTALTERFSALIGTTPFAYLTDWRMQIAAHWLKESGMTIERLAERCGYDSVPAFSKAFKRSFGTSPGAYRRFLDAGARSGVIENAGKYLAKTG